MSEYGIWWEISSQYSIFLFSPYQQRRYVLPMFFPTFHELYLEACFFHVLPNGLVGVWIGGDEVCFFICFQLRRFSLWNIDDTELSFGFEDTEELREYSGEIAILDMYEYEGTEDQVKGFPLERKIFP